MTVTKPAQPAETSGTEITRFNALRHGLCRATPCCPGRTLSSITP